MRGWSMVSRKTRGEVVRRAGLGLVAWTLVGCYRGGDGGGDGTGDGTGGSGDESAGASDGETPEAPELGGVGISGVRRLSRDEYDNTVRDLLGDDTRPGTQMLPEDVIDPFDN